MEYGYVNNTSEIRRITPAEMDHVIDQYCDGVILIGRYITEEDGKFIACDNRYDNCGDGCFVESFDDEATARSWLNDEFEVV